MTSTIAELVDNNLLVEAAEVAKQESTSALELWRVIFHQLVFYRFDRASRFLAAVWEEINASNEVTPNLVRFVSALLTNGHLNLAVQWSFTLCQLNPQNRPNPVDCIGHTISKGNLDLALKSIAELPPALISRFNIPQLISGLVQQNNLVAARKWSVKFGLEKQFPLQDLYERMMQCEQWENALNLKQLSNQKRVPIDFIKRVIASRDWSSVAKFVATQLGPAQEQRDLLQYMVEEMLAAGRYDMAMKQIFTHVFLQDLPGLAPRDLVMRMIQNNEACCVIRNMVVLGMGAEDVGGQQVIDSLLAQRDRELVQFRNLVKLRSAKRQQRNKNARDQMVVVASAVLGSHFAVELKRGKVQRQHTIEGFQQDTADDDDDDDEEIVFVARPGNKPPQQQQTTTPPVHNSARFQQQMQALFGQQQPAPSFQAPPPQPVQYRPPPTFVQQRNAQANNSPFAGYPQLPPKQQQAAPTPPIARAKKTGGGFLTPSQLY